ncbi:MAG: pirin family protein [Methanomicrobiales archaeon]|nr:pirin family protein [Methanomicrobiales archaeon]
MNKDSPVRKVLTASETREGAGVKLYRAFGYHDIPEFDPFLMLDDFRNESPSDYMKGFPWHPHRGIETVTYMLEGEIEHKDSMGNSGTVGAGAVQWMTAGSGIIHQEMPKPVDGKMGGFQLWVNLPRSEKFHPPRYQEISPDRIPEDIRDNGIRVRVIAGQYGRVIGPVREIIAEPEFLDVYVPPETRFYHQVRPGFTGTLYMIEGRGTIGFGDPVFLKNRSLVLLEQGAVLDISAGLKGCRFLWISGKPIGEPIAWGGPIVMNTQEEVETAFSEYQNGMFIR